MASYAALAKLAMIFPTTWSGAPLIVEFRSLGGGLFTAKLRNRLRRSWIPMKMDRRFPTSLSGMPNWAAIMRWRRADVSSPVSAACGYLLMTKQLMLRSVAHVTLDALSQDRIGRIYKSRS